MSAVPSRSAQAAQFCADTGCSFQSAARRFGITHTAVWFAWRRLFGARPAEFTARRAARNAEIAALADQGWTAQRLAGKFGLSLFSIRRIAKHLGSFARDAYNVDPEALRSALRMVRRGATYRDAAREEGLGESTVARAARQAGVKRRRVKAKRMGRLAMADASRTSEPEERLGPQGRAAVARYRPIDAVLSDWCVLVLRAARRFDWFDPGELSVALDIPSSNENRRARDCFDQAVCKLTRRGQLERTGRRMAYQYRITDAGRLEYERQLRRAA